MSTLEGLVLTEQGWRAARVRFGARIEAIESMAPRAAPMILPGFVDLHVHGGGGADVMAGADSVRRMASLHARHGTTSLLATSVTAPPAGIEAALEGIAAAAAKRAPGEARVLGAHLEGPFISTSKLGAQPPFARDPDPGLLERWCRHRVRIVTLAPELPGAMDLIRWLRARGIRPQLGHSACSAEQAAEALRIPGTGITHLFNAMSGADHREPGLAAAALAHARDAEIIPDLVHVHADALRLALRAIPRLYVVSDASAAAGMPDGRYPLGAREVEKRGEVVRLADGRLAGSALTLDQALLNLVALGLALDDAARRLSTFPADVLGLADRGRIAIGAHADLVVLDPALRIDAVYVEGEAVYAEGEAVV